MKNKKERLVILLDGTGMDGEMIVFRTNVPRNRLLKLEKESFKVPYVDVPRWSDILKNEGYVFSVVDYHPNMTPYSSSKAWKEKHFGNVKEEYVIDYV